MSTKQLTVLEKSDEAIRLQVDTEPARNQQITVGRAGQVAIGIDPIDTWVSNLALTITSVHDGWQVAPTNQNGVDLYLWGLGRQRRLTAVGPIRAGRIALRVIGNTDRIYWVLLEDRSAYTVPVGPQWHTNERLPTDQRQPLALSDLQQEALRVVFAEHLRWPPELRPRLRKAVAVARTFERSVSGIKARLELARQKLEELGFPALNPTDPGFIDGFIESGLLQPTIDDIDPALVAARARMHKTDAHQSGS